MTIEFLRNMVTIALNVATTLAKLTSSTVDDTIVAYLQGIASSETVWQIIAAFLGMAPTPTPTPVGGGDLVLLSQGAAGTKVSMSGALQAKSEAAGISTVDLNRALAGTDLKGFDVNSIAMLIQLVIAIFTAIKKKK